MRSTLQIPPLGVQPTLRLPPYAELTLAGGLRVLAVHAPWSPTLEVTIQLPVRRVRDHTAAALVFADLLPRRTDRWSQAEVRRRLGVLGATVSATIDLSWLRLSASMAASDRDLVLDVVAEILTGGPPKESELSESLHRTRHAATVVRAQPAVTARQLHRTRRHGPEAPLVVPTDEDYQSVTAQDVAWVHGQCLRPTGGHLVLVGDIDPSEALEAVRARLGSWLSGNVGEAVPRVFPPRPVRGIEVVRVPGQAHSQLIVTAPGISAADPRFPAFALANCAFGGYFSSRLMTTLREREGLVYQIDSLVEDGLDERLVLIGAGTTSGSAAAACRSVRRELDRLTTEPLTDAEIDSARAFMIGMLVTQTSTQSGILGQILLALSHDTEPDWMVELPDRLRAVSALDVRAAAADFYSPERFAGILLGDVPEEAVSW